MKKESEVIGKKLLDAIKSYVAKAVAAVRAEFEVKLAAIPHGADGKNADPKQVLELVVSEVKKAVESIPPGKPGENGKDGKDAEPFHPDTLRLVVRDEAERALSAIPKPVDGRDALDLEILSSIDESKSYSRGTFASHNGGFVRAIRQTDPITNGLVEAGWAIIVEGVSAVVVSQLADLRSFSIGVMLTSGIMSVSEFSMPVQLYKGVWLDSKEYSAGDTVTQQGSQWHCNVENCKSKPGTNPQDWTLSTKRGADGKDFDPKKTAQTPPPVVRTK